MLSRWLSLIAVIGLAAPGAAAEPARAEVTTQDVKYDGLAKVIREHTGQVVVVDFWGIL
jgi:hypothetical protein